MTTTDLTTTNPLSIISLSELADMERTYGVRLTLPKTVRRQLDAFKAPPVQLPLLGR